MEVVVWPIKSQNIPFHPYIFTYKYPFQWIFGLIRGFWFLLPYPYWTLTRTPVGYIVLTSCLRDFVALELQIPPLHMLQQNTYHDEIDIDVGVGYLRVLDWVWVINGLVSSPAFPACHHLAVAISKSFKVAWNGVSQRFIYFGINSH